MVKKCNLDSENRFQISKLEAFQFQNWIVYQKSINLVKTTDPISAKISKIGNKMLADQIRRASQSIPLNIAEGASRFTSNDKLSYLRIAKGSLFECVAAIDIAKGLEIIEEETRAKYCDAAAEIGKMLSGMMNAIKKGGRKG
jgi:four helix bundle protein